MKRTLLTFLILSTIFTYSRGQTSNALAMNSSSVSNGDDMFSYSAPAMELGTGDQDDAPLITFYPNPVKDYLNIRFKERGDYIIRIYNVVGAKVKEKRVEDDSTLKLDLTDIPKGMYFLSYEPGNGKVITKTFTKEQ